MLSWCCGMVESLVICNLVVTYSLTKQSPNQHDFDLHHH